MTEEISTIVKTIKSISNKEQSSAGAVISKLTPEEQASLLKQLKFIDNQSQKKTKTDKKKQEEQEKAQDEGRFIGRLVEKTKMFSNEEVTIKTRFYNCRDLLLHKETDETKMIEHFGKLSQFCADLTVLQCMANMKQGEIIALMKTHGFSTEGATKRLCIPPRFAECLYTFQGFVRKFPLLCYVGYSFETLLKYKTAIEKHAKEDENFCSRLGLKLTIKFKVEDDDVMLSQEASTIGV